MSEIQLEIEGEGAVAATEELLQTPGVTGNWQPASEEAEREGVLATIATIIGITLGTVELAEKIYAWYQKRRKQANAERIEKVVLIGRNGQRILLANATVEQIQKILDS